MAIMRKQKKNVKLCMVGIQKKNVNIKHFRKNKIFTLSSLEYSISLGEVLN